MGKKVERILPGFCIVLLLLGSFACAPKPALNIRYTLPAAGTALANIKTRVDFVDKRGDLYLLDKAARMQLSDFTGKFTFQTGPDKLPEKSDLFDLSALFKKTLQKRLEIMSASPAANPEAADATLRLILNTFKLRFVDGSWKAEIAYEAQVLVGADVKAREKVSGKAERVKIIGTDDADKVLGDLYTDVINQLNLEKMFHKAGLI